MSMAYVCQGGCGTYATDPSAFEERGIVTPRSYCKDCLVEIDQYLADRDALHTKLAEDWAYGLASLKAKYHEVKGRILPDD